MAVQKAGYGIVALSMRLGGRNGRHRGVGNERLTREVVGVQTSAKDVVTLWFTAHCRLAAQQWGGKRS